MEINEVNSKGGCLRLAVKHLKQLQYNTMEALAWLERSEAFVPDESKTMQELRAAMIESLQREEALRGNLVKSEGSRDELKAALAKSIERETELERRLAASFAREIRLIIYIGGLSKMAAEAESILEDVSKIGMIIPTQDEGSTPWGQVLDNSPEACCGNYEECDKQCVPLANHWRNRAREAEKAETKAPTHHPSPHLDQEKFKHTGTFRVAEEDQARQGLAKPVEQPTGAKFPPWYNANSEFKA
jgi:hypothetical protein